jgi:hypothetical protein
MSYENITCATKQQLISSLTLYTSIASKYAFTASHASKHAPSGVEGVVETTTIHRRRQVGNFRRCRSVS